MEVSFDKEELMIFVTVGTQDKPFNRLLEAVDKLNINEKIVIQKGISTCQIDKKNIEIYDYISSDKFINFMKEARVVITHAGVASIITGLKLHKKMIVAARLEKYKEHVNDHQLQILDTFSKEGYILRLDNFEELDKLIEKDFEPKEFISNRDNFVKSLDLEIKRLVK